jgi:peptide/nickel transport system substrate-binding protein
MRFFTHLKRVLLVTSVVALAASTACSKVGTTASGVHPWTKPGVLRIGEAYDPKSLNVVLDQSVITGDISFFIDSYAVRYDDQSRPVPDALSEIPTVANGDVSKDGKTLIYKLRHDIKWQDGPPLTCADLVFTWRYVMDPKTNISTTDGYRDIGSIDCRDRFTAVIHMKRLYAPFLQQLFSVNSNAPILPEHILEPYLKAGTQNTAPYNSLPIGSGPFRVVEWQRGTVVRMVANPDFYLGAPKLKEVDIYSEPDENTLETQVQTHAIDMLARGTPINWPRYQALAAAPNSGLIAIAPQQYTWDHIDFNEKNPILADVQVRRALEYATNRNEIISKIMHGAETPAEVPESPGYSWAYTNDVMHYPFDPAKARALLDADGWHVGPGGIRQKNGQRLELDMSTQTENVMGQSIEAFVQREWHDAGVQVLIKNYPTAEMFGNGPDAILMGGHYDVAEFGWSGGADPDMASLFSDQDIPPQGQDTLFWVDPAASADLAQTLGTIDQAQRKRAYIAFEQRFAIDAASFIIGFRRYPYVYNTDLKGFTPSPVISAFWDPWEYSL